MIDWLTDRLTDWLTDWLIDWLIDWLTDRSIGRSVGWLVNRFIDWFMVWLIGWLINWFIHSFIHSLIHWSIDRSKFFFLAMTKTQSVNVTLCYIPYTDSVCGHVGFRIQHLAHWLWLQSKVSLSLWPLPSHYVYPIC